MKKTFLSRRNALLTRKSGGVALVLIAIVVLLVALRLLLPSTLLSATAPLLRASNALASASNTFFAGFTNTRRVVAERDGLTLANQKLAEQNAVLEAKLAQLGGSIATSGTLAGVLARPPVSPYDTLVVSAGESEGVALGDVALTPSGVPLGSVSSVSAHAARVTLYSSSGSKIAAWVGEDRTPISLIGSGASFYATLPKSASTTVGARVVVAGALPIGTVGAVESDPSSPEVVVRVAPIVNLFSVTEVMLVAGSSAWPSVQ